MRVRVRQATRQLTAHLDGSGVPKSVTGRIGFAGRAVDIHQRFGGGSETAPVCFGGKRGYVTSS